MSEIEDCGQDGVCKLSPGCNRHWEERNGELVRELDEWRRAIEDALGLDDDRDAHTLEVLVKELRALVARHRLLMVKLDYWKVDSY